MALLDIKLKNLLNQILGGQNREGRSFSVKIKNDGSLSGLNTQTLAEELYR